MVLTDEALRLVASRFRALGDPNRLRVLNTLMGAEHGVSELLEATGSSSRTCLDTSAEKLGVARMLARLKEEGAPPDLELSIRAFRSDLETL